ncbi:MAG: 30S ribosomal protein S27ae [Candidatus Woesearchaeota archaeon]
MAAKPSQKKRTSARWKNYQVAGKSLTRKNKFCPKCGNGVFMAKHKDRWTCGACQYMEKI